MADIDETLRKDLQDPEFSEGYAESFLDTYVATQLKVLREQRDLTQREVAKCLGTSQGVVSRFEDADYASWNIRTLKKFARLFEVRLHISFETYGSLIGEMKEFSRKNLERVPRHADPVLFGSNYRKTTAHLDQFQRTLFEDARKYSGTIKRDIMVAPATGAGTTNAVQVGTIYGGNVVDFLAHKQQKELGRDPLAAIGVAHAR